MKNALINLNANSLLTFERALNAYHDELFKISGEFCYQANTQPKETFLLVFGDEQKAHLKEVERVVLLKKQIAYQKKLLKIED